jgi:hypothetical protein
MSRKSSVTDKEKCDRPLTDKEKSKKAIALLP